jgi:hypothetical protein
MNSRIQQATPHNAGSPRLNSIPSIIGDRIPGPAADQVSLITGGKNRPLWLKTHPLTLCLLGLAFAVFLWGLEYKVSLYHPHAKHSARMAVAKLWVGPRKAVSARNSRIQFHAPPAPALQLLHALYVSARDSKRYERCWEDGLIPAAGFVPHSGIPRAPPSI